MHQTSVAKASSRAADWATQFGVPLDPAFLEHAFGLTCERG